MATINAIQCSTNLKNTGVCDCFFDPKLITGSILIPKNRVLTQAEVTAIQATLEALTQTTRALRIFPVQNFVAITDGSEEPTFQTFGYGSTVPVREGKYIWTFQFAQGGVQLSNALRSFNGLSSKYAVLFIESTNVLIGTKKADADGNDGLAGIPMEGGYPYTYPWKANDGSNVASYRIQFVFQPAYVNENIAFAKIETTDYLLTELAGLEDVDITIVEEDETADTLLLKAVTECGYDLYDDYADELATPTAWIVKDAAGNTIPHTVAANAAGKGWLITYSGADDVTDGDTVALAAPTVLAAAPINVSGYESDTATVDLGSGS